MATASTIPMFADASAAAPPTVADHPAACLFESIVQRNYDTLLKLYATNGRNSIISYLSMKSRWAQQQENYSKSEEKLDEFLQQLSYSDPDGDLNPNHSNRRLSPMSAARAEDDSSYYYLLQELTAILTDQKCTPTTTTATTTSPNHHNNTNNNDYSYNNMGGYGESPSATAAMRTTLVSKDVERLVWEASGMLSDTRPPGNLCVYNREGATAPPRGNEMAPPIFDGSVANATPPPLGGASAGASGGSGTILHLCCAMDQPLALAFLLCMGADGRASHTAFRRLMIHEAACNGSIHCLTLLLEMGHKYAADQQKNESSIFLPAAFELNSSNPLAGTAIRATTTTSTTTGGPSLSSRIAARPAPAIAMNLRHFRREASSSPSSSPLPIKEDKGEFLAVLRHFQRLVHSVQRGEMTELQAARALMENAFLLDTTRTSLVRSCAFKNESLVSRTFLRPHGCADGHGNTPLHWAAFKNETECVSLLLHYNADPNARAHPSGWTPLHDAAYSNSSESIELLVNKGAQVDARANSGATPLCFAAQEDAANAAGLLLQRGADLTARCAGSSQDDGGPTQQTTAPHSRFSGYTPLHYCAHYNAHKAAKVLLKHTAAAFAMETPDLSGRLPIHVAVARGSSDVLKELLHAGARVDIRPGMTGGPIVPTNVRTGGNAAAAALFALTAAGAEPQQQQQQPRQLPPQPPSPETPGSPIRNRIRALSSSSSTSPVTSPVLRSMIPSQPITSTKPWNCLTQRAIDECRELISKAEQSWSPDHHLLFTPQDRKAVMELLRVGKRLEQQGTGIFVDLWPFVLSFCGRGWFEQESSAKPLALSFDQKSTKHDGDDDVSISSESHSADDYSEDDDDDDDNDDYLALPSLSNN